jgi:uncharacterized protein YbjT (DUF2867 family)
VSVVLVFGGTGRLGTHAVLLLRARGHTVRVLSRRTGGDLRTGVGVREAAAGVSPLAPLPLRAKMQPVAAEEVARRCVDLLEGESLGDAPDFGGPEIRTVRELLDLWPGRLRVLPLPIVGRLLHALAEGRNTTPAHADGRLTWAQYLARR